MSWFPKIGNFFTSPQGTEPEPSSPQSPENRKGFSPTFSNNEGEETPKPLKNVQKEGEKDSWIHGKVKSALLYTFIKVAKPEAENYLSSLLIKEEGEEMDKNFDDLAAEIPFADIIDQSLSPEISKGLMLHFLANVAKSAFEGREAEAQGNLTREKLAQEVTIKIASELADGINEIDSRLAQSQGLELNSELVQSCLTSRLLNLFLPKKADRTVSEVVFKGEKWVINQYSNELSQTLMKLYGPLSKWSKGEPVDFSTLGLNAEEGEESEFKSLIPFMERTAFYIGNCLANYFKEDDEKFLTELTGKNDIQEIIKKISPSLKGFILNEIIPEQFKSSADKNSKEIENITEAFILRILTSLAREAFKGQPKGQTVEINKFVQKVTLEFVAIFNNELKNIPENKPLTAEMFLPLSEKLIGLLIPKTETKPKNDSIGPATSVKKDPIALFLEPKRSTLATPIAGKILELYKCISQRDDSEVYKQRLREVLWDPIALAEKYPNLTIPLKPTNPLKPAKANSEKIDEEILKEQLNLEVFVDQLYSACRNSINFGGSFIAKIFSDPKAIIDQTEAIIGKETGYTNCIQEMAKGASALIKSDDPNLAWMTDKVKTAIQVTLFKGLVHFLEKVEPKDRHPPEKLFYKAFEQGCELGNDHLPALSRAISYFSNPTSEGYIEDENQRKIAIEAVSEPFITDLIKLFYEDKDGKTTLEDHLPIPESWGTEPRKKLADKIRKGLPGLLPPIILKFNSWIETKEESRQRLEKQYHSPKMGEACRLISAMIPFYVPYHARKKAAGMSKKALEMTDFLFTRPGEKKESEDFSQLKKVIEETLKEFGNSDNVAIKNILSFTENFTEAATLKVFGDFTEIIKNMHEASEKDPNGTLLVQGTNIVLKEVKDHLRLMAKTKIEYKKYKKGKISKAEMKKKFADAGKLHPALGAGRFSEREKFFKECSQEIFKIGGYSKDSDLPIPQFLKAPFWNMFESKLMPFILSDLFKNVTDPDTLNRVMIIIFQQINEAAGNVDVQLPDEQLTKYKDDPQYRMEKISGKLFEALVLMQPSAVTRWLLKNRKVRAMAGQTIAQPLRERLEKSTYANLPPPLSIMLELVENILPSLHPGFWDEKTGKFICEKELENGQRIVIAKPDYSMNCPKTPEEEEKLKNKIAKEKQANSVKVVEEMAGGLHNSTQYMFLKIFRQFWRSVRRFIDKAIDKVFRKFSPSVKRVVNRFLDFLESYFMKPALVLATYPALYLVKKILRFYLEFQSEMRAKDIKDWKKQHKNTALYSLQKFLKYAGQVADLSKHRKGKPMEGISLADYTSRV